MLRNFEIEVLVGGGVVLRANLEKHPRMDHRIASGETNQAYAKFYRDDQVDELAEFVKRLLKQTRDEYPL